MGRLDRCCCFPAKCEATYSGRIVGLTAGCKQTGCKDTSCKDTGRKGSLCRRLPGGCRHSRDMLPVDGELVLPSTNSTPQSHLLLVDLPRHTVEEEQRRVKEGKRVGAAWRWARVGSMQCQRVHAHSHPSVGARLLARQLLLCMDSPGTCHHCCQTPPPHSLT